jgi:transcriptional regulator with XRE-family HTH domain
MPNLRNNERVLDDAQRKRIGGRLRSLRIEQGLDQIELAKRAKISTGTVQTIEWGIRKNKDENIDAVARVLGTTLAALEQKPHINPTDPLLKGLNREDLEIARAYHEASTAVRDHARRLLRDREPQRPSEPTTDELSALATSIARLTEERRQLVTELVTQLKDLEDRDDKTG